MRPETFSDKKKLSIFTFQKKIYDEKNTGNRLTN